MSTEGIAGVNNTESIEYPGYAGTARPAESGSGVDFSAVIADAMKDEITKMAITSSPDAAGMTSGYMPIGMESQGIEQMILAAASSGETSDAQIALFMLCMMMQTGGQNSDYSMIMQMMATMLTQIQGDKTSLRDSVMSSGYDPYILDTIDWNVFNTMQGYSGTARAITPNEAWRPAAPAIKSNEDNRSPELYNAVISQFRVETAERYRPFRNDATYCNIFMWDVTSAMGAEIPHYTDPESGEPRYYPDVGGAKAMTAIEIDKWLKTYGSEYGWHQVDARTAQEYANEGKPAVTAGGSLDHVQVVCPSRNGQFDPIRGVTVAQAGSRVTSYSYISSIYGAGPLENVTYWIHE